MLLSAVTPLSGVTIDRAIQVLKTEQMNLANLQGNNADKRLGNYHRWAAQASEQLGYVFSLNDVDWLIATQRHWALVARITGYNEALVNGMISAEQKDRDRLFTATLEQMEALRLRCEALPEKVLVPDTNIYLHQVNQFDYLNWHKIAGTAHLVRVLIPMAVLRELDRQKRVGSGAPIHSKTKDSVKTRARVTAREVQKMFGSPHDIVLVKPMLEFELLLDPVGHRPIDDSDTEIIDRVAALQAVAGRSIQVVTEDNGMKISAMVAGLEVATV